MREKNVGIQYRTRLKTPPVTFPKTLPVNFRSLDLALHVDLSGAKSPGGEISVFHLGKQCTEFTFWTTLYRI